MTSYFATTVSRRVNVSSDIATYGSASIPIEPIFGGKVDIVFILYENLDRLLGKKFIFFSDFFLSFFLKLASTRVVGVLDKT